MSRGNEEGDDMDHDHLYETGRRYGARLHARDLGPGRLADHGDPPEDWTAADEAAWWRGVCDGWAAAESDAVALEVGREVLARRGIQ